MADRDLKDLRALTNGEKLWLFRAHVGATQAERGAAHGVSEKVYCACERDRSAEVTIVLPWRPRNVPRGLLCRLARRRHGTSLRATANAMKISHTELLRRERTSDARLIEAWKGMGYRF